MIIIVFLTLVAMKLLGLRSLLPDCNIILSWFSMASNSIVIEFIIGYLLAHYYHNVVFIINNIRHSVFMVTLVFMASFVFLEYKTIWFVSDRHVGVMLLPAVVIFVYCIKLFDIEKRSVPKFILFTSRISYSLYLLHMAVIFTVIEGARLLFGSEVFGDFSARFNLFFVSLFFSWVVSYFFCLGVEEKLSRIIKGYLLR